MQTILKTQSVNGHSMVEELFRVAVLSPRSAGWAKPENWQELGFLHTPDFAAPLAQHDELLKQLQAVSAEVISMPAALGQTLDAVYVHDPSLATDFGVIIMNPGKPNRVPEANFHKEFYQQQGIPILGEILSPGTTEAGDMVWLDEKTLLIGRGYRTNAAGIAQMSVLLAPHGIEVLSAPLPYGPGPSACLHLMSLISLLDEHTALVDLPRLAVETVELLKARGYRFIEIDYSERETLACNVLALGRKRLLAIEENHQTNQRLRAEGFDVRTFPGLELCVNGGGGPTCLTRPLLRG